MNTVSCFDNTHHVNDVRIKPINKKETDDGLEAIYQFNYLIITFEGFCN